MKNKFCELNEKEIKKMPDDVQGILFSPFGEQDGYVNVPIDTFKEMIDLIIKYTRNTDA